MVGFCGSAYSNVSNYIFCGSMAMSKPTKISTHQKFHVLQYMEYDMHQSQSITAADMFQHLIRVLVSGDIDKNTVV